MPPTGKLGSGLPLRLGTFATEAGGGTFGFGQAQAQIIVFGVNAFAQARAKIQVPTICNTTSPTGNVLVVTGTTETILPGCDIQGTPTGSSVTINYDIWISHNQPGTYKQETIYLKRNDTSGAILDSFSTPPSGGDGGDNSGGHQWHWSGSFVDSSPTTGHYIISVKAVQGSPNIYSDTRTFCVVGVVAGVSTQNGFGQAQADIKQTYNGFGQSQASIVYKRWAFGQAQAQILLKRFVLGQAQADILHVYLGFGQSQALIVVRDIEGFGQASASIVYKRWSFGQARAVTILANPGGGGGGGDGTGADTNFGPPQYVVVYNGFQLPGYPQSETVEIKNRVADPTPFGWDGFLSQQAGLNNPSLSIDFLIYTTDGWHNAKERFHMADRILRSDRGTFAPLYIDYLDRYWMASVIEVNYQKQVGNSMRILPYTVHFEVEPWIIGKKEYTITGANGTLTTLNRTLDDGAWTPTRIRVTGTDVTISGYTDTEFTGFISISGAVADMVIDTASYTAELNGESAVDRMRWADFALFVGAGTTNFDVTGATSIEIKYSNRWY